MPPAPKPRRPRKQRADPRFSTNHPPELIARALLDADQFGDMVAAERYGVHRNTIANWRLAAPAAPLVSSEMKRLREEVRAGWIDRAKEVRLKAIERVGELLGEARNLTSAVNAARRIHEIILSDEILNEDPGAAADALRNITLDMLAAALPFDWRVRIERSGGAVSWASLTAAAYERAGEIGVSGVVWAEAQAELGRAGAAVLVLLADADSIERQGSIRCPAAWVRAMTTRAGDGPLRLSRNLFGLLHRTRGADGPCPTPVVHPHFQTWRNPSCLVS